MVKTKCLVEHEKRIMSKQGEQYLRASELMLEALDAAEGLFPRYMECLHFNIYQLTARMLQDSKKKDVASNYPMRRHDFGKHENPGA